MALILLCRDARHETRLDRQLGGGQRERLLGELDRDAVDLEQDAARHGRGDDIVVGNAGDDSLDGSAGVDRVYGGAGNDSYYVNAAGDVVVEVAGGSAGGSVGATAVAQSAHDGYTLLLGTGSTHGTNPLVYTKLGYDPVRDFAPVALITSAPLMLVANNDVPVKNAADLIALAKAKPGQLSFGSYGTGSNNHLIAELLNSMAGIQTNHIPYRGSAPMMTDLIGGRIQFAFDGIATTVGDR